ncbi:hypothetical protein C0J52_09149 [Blattella germanica]|nr:hypothetical protein C0J52_09149 [Blattella germanica]
MGVKNLWLILSPVCERKSLWELENKAVAIDLSCWICDSQNVAENAVQPRMYLRNLFFRTSCLLLLGVKPIFVLEGQAPALKHDAMSQRVQQRFRNKKLSSSSEEETDKSKQNKARNHGVRSRFNSLLKQLVNGCITQDGDCFLYGAQTVFRNFTISPHGSTGYSVEVYEMNVIEEKLSLSRQKLIALSLLCGCDYNDKGVLGVGKETALKFLEKIEDSHVLERLKQWRTDPYYQNLENEFANLADTCSKCSHSGKLNKHNKSGCDVCELSKEKFLPLVTRWQLTHLKKCGTKTNLTSLPLTPTTIVKKRVQKGVPSFEVKWEDSQNILSNVENPEELLVTIEPQELLEAAYPNLVEEFIIAKEAKSKKGK